MPPKAFAVLCHLADHPGKLVTKEQLLDVIWGDVHVTDGALKRCVTEVRKALEDPADEPCYVQTLHGRGYRFLQETVITAGSNDGVDERRAVVVGRKRELEALDASFEKASAGVRQIVFIIGEAGMGKTTLVDHWLGALPGRGLAPRGAAIGRGRCLQQFGSGEPYLPVFEALEDLSRSIGPRVAAILRTHAPTWLLHMPSLISVQDRIQLREEAFGSTRERMLREITNALEMLSAEAPLVLVLEDLHWSDPSTIDLLTAIATRPVSSNLMILATHRPAEIGGTGHPLRRMQQELSIHGQCLLMPLGYLTEEDVGTYVASRFSGSGFRAVLSGAIHRRTNGNPLFVSCIVDELMRLGTLDLDPDRIREILPDTLQNMFEHQVDELTEAEREIVNAAATDGELFSVSSVAAALQRDPAEVEALCEALSRRQIIFRRAETVRFPDGAVSPRYSFLHVLCRDALYRRLPPRAQARLHGMLGHALEVLYHADPSRVAGELAGHFEFAGNFPTAIHYLRVAADAASARFANQEAAGHLERAIDLIDRISGSEKESTRMELLEQRALMRMSTMDLAGSAADFAVVSEQARVLSDVKGQVKALLDSVMPWAFLDYRRGLAAIDEARALRSGTDPVLAALGDAYCAGTRAFFFGWNQDLENLLNAALPVLNSVSDPAVRCRFLWMSGLVRSAASDYRASCRAAEESRRCARKTGSFHQYFLPTANLIMSLIYCGNLGQAIRIAREDAGMASANHHRLEQFWLDSLQARVAIEAFDSESALPICERLASQAVLMNYHLTPHVLLWLGLARFGVGAVDGASAAFDQFATAVEAGGIGFEYRFPLLQGQASCAFARGDCNRARDFAARSVRLAQEHHAFGFAARGLRLLSEIASQEGDYLAAAEHISAAMAVLTDREMLNTEWQVCATAARTFGVLGRSGESEQARSRALLLGERVSATLAAEPVLQASLLARINDQLAPRFSI